jgi:hypothetical protein
VNARTKPGSIGCPAPAPPVMRMARDTTKITKQLGHGGYVTGRL